MKTMKRALGMVLALTLAVFAFGCSTPATAMSVGEVDYPTSEYLAYLYQNASQIYSYYSYFGDTSTIWSQTLPYENPYDFSADDEDEADEEKAETTTTATGAAIEIEENTMPIADYIKKATQDQLVYFSALKALMDENKLAISEEDLTAADNAMATYKEADLLEKGFSLDSFRKAYINSTYLEDTVWMGLFGKDGKQATKQADIDKYFDDNYLVYEIIQVALEDSEGNALTEAEIADKKAELEGYRNVFYATGDFDQAIAAYDAATTVDSENANDADKTKYDTDYAGEPKANVTSNNSQNVQTVDAGADNADADLVKLIRSVKEGEVALTEYKQNGKNRMAALIYRIDPDGKGRETYRADSEEAIIKSLRKADFEKLVQAKMDAQKDSVKINARAVKMCDPQKFFE